MTGSPAPDKLLQLPEIVRELVSVIGKKLTPYVANSSDNSAVDRWINGVKPRSEVAQRLRFAHQLVMTLRSHEKPEVVQVWLIGINPEL